MLKVEDIKFDEDKKLMSVAVSLPMYDYFNSLDEAHRVMNKKFSELPEEIEIFYHSVKTYDVAIMSPEKRCLFVFNYRRLTPEQLKDKKETERINHFVNNLIKI